MKKQLSRLEKVSLQIYVAVKELKKEYDVEARQSKRKTRLRIIKGGKKD